jgi:hypothetical protein
MFEAMAEEKIGDCADRIIFDRFGDGRKRANGFCNLAEVVGRVNKAFERADGAS